MTTLEQFLDHYRHGGFVCTAEGKLLFANAASETLFYPLSIHPHKSNLHQLFSSNPEILNAFNKAATQGGSFTLRDVTIELARDKKKILDIEIFSIPPHNHIACIFIDRKLTVSIEWQQKRQEKADYLKTVAAGLAHEIKNPLSGIQGASQLLSQELKGNPELSECAEIIFKESKRINQLMTQLLHLAKPILLQKTTCNLNQILHDIVALQKSSSKNPITFIEQYDPSLPAIQGDAASLTQVFLNLIKNAVQATTQNGTVTITSRFSLDHHLIRDNKRLQAVVATISDNGSGMSEENRQKIFVPFFTTKAEGTGLGLTLCHQIIEQHGGDIRVESESGHGSTFTIYLPVAA